MYNLSSICKAANELTKKGYTKSESFKKAWELAKNIVSKVAGVSFGKRTAAIDTYKTKGKKLLFVLAHELGHSALHNGKIDSALYSSNREYRRKFEREADEYARILLNKIDSEVV